MGIVKKKNCELCEKIKENIKVFSENVNNELKCSRII